MAGNFKVFWSERSSLELDHIIAYLLSNWSQKEVDRFLNKLVRAVLLLADRPFLFPESAAKKGLRRLVLTKQISIFYTVHDSEIFIVSLFDTRRNPEDLV